MKRLFVIFAALAVAACSRPEPEPTPAPQPTAEAAPGLAPGSDSVPAGAYTLEKSHATLIFRVNHLGFSNYTARFKRFDAQLQFDPANLAASILTVTVDPTSLETDFPDPAKLDFNAELLSERWLDVAKYPQISYRSVSLEPTGPHTVRVNGELTLHGVTKPVALNVRYNGGYDGHPMDPNARIGFSATGSLNRSEFGVAYGIPEPGSMMGVSDKVEIIIEAEFTGPRMKEADSG